jgi:hypothetical protein
MFSFPPTPTTSIIGYICIYGHMHRRYTHIANQHHPISQTSHQIATTIRRYPRNRYNARVYHQRCKACSKSNRNSKSNSSSNLSSNSSPSTPSVQPIVDDSYAERVAYRIKKWCGVRMEPPPFSGRARAPHRRDLCEGCRWGVCAGSRDG